MRHLLSLLLLFAAVSVTTAQLRVQLYGTPFAATVGQPFYQVLGLGGEAAVNLTPKRDVGIYLGAGGRYIDYEGLEETGTKEQDAQLYLSLGMALASGFEVGALLTPYTQNRWQWAGPYPYHFAGYVGYRKAWNRDGVFTRFALGTDPTTTSYRLHGLIDLGYSARF